MLDSLLGAGTVGGCGPNWRAAATKTITNRTPLPPRESLTPGVPCRLFPPLPGLRVVSEGVECHQEDARHDHGREEGDLGPGGGHAHKGRPGGDQAQVGGQHKRQQDAVRVWVIAPAEIQNHWEKYVYSHALEKVPSLTDEDAAF